MFWVLIETVLLSTHNICFGWEIRKDFFCYALLTKGLYLMKDFREKLFSAVMIDTLRVIDSFVRPPDNR